LDEQYPNNQHQKLGSHINDRSFTVKEYHYLIWDNVCMDVCLVNQKGFQYLSLFSTCVTCTRATARTTWDAAVPAPQGPAV